MATGIPLDALLVRTPGVCSGRLHLDGARVTVLQIVTLYERGETPRRDRRKLPAAESQPVYAALPSTTPTARKLTKS